MNRILDPNELEHVVEAVSDVSALVGGLGTVRFGEGKFLREVVESMLRYG